jgi:hypothetical protein
MMRLLRMLAVSLLAGPDDHRHQHRHWLAVLQQRRDQRRLARLHDRDRQLHRNHAPGRDQLHDLCHLLADHDRDAYRGRRLHGQRREQPAYRRLGLRCTSEQCCDRGTETRLRHVMNIRRLVTVVSVVTLLALSIGAAGVHGPASHGGGRVTAVSSLTITALITGQPGAVRNFTTTSGAEQTLPEFNPLIHLEC